MPHSSTAPRRRRDDLGRSTPGPGTTRPRSQQGPREGPAFESIALQWIYSKPGTLGPCFQGKEGQTDKRGKRWVRGCKFQGNVSAEVPGSRTVCRSGRTTAAQSISVAGPWRDLPGTTAETRKKVPEAGRELIPASSAAEAVSSQLRPAHAIAYCCLHPWRSGGWGAPRFIDLAPGQLRPLVALTAATRRPRP